MCSSQMPNYISFVIVRFLNAFAVISLFGTSFTYMLEFSGGKYKTLVGIGIEFTWVSGRVATKIFEDFGGALFKEFITGQEPVSTIH